MGEAENGGGCLPVLRLAYSPDAGRSPFSTRICLSKNTDFLLGNNVTKQEFGINGRRRASSHLCGISNKTPTGGRNE